MISREQVDAFARYRADRDAFARMASPADRQLLMGDVWGRLDMLVTALGQLEAGVLSPTYARGVRSQLAHDVPDPEAQTTLRALAGALASRSAV